jgi:hypothetical protein
MPKYKWHSYPSKYTISWIWHYSANSCGFYEISSTLTHVEQHKMIFLWKNLVRKDKFSYIRSEDDILIHVTNYGHCKMIFSN